MPAMFAANADLEGGMRGASPADSQPHESPDAFHVQHGGGGAGVPQGK